MNDHFVWPSDADRAESDELNRVCEYLEEVLDHIRDATKMVKGNVALAGDITDEDGTTFHRALLIQFTDDASLRAAVDSGQCRFTVFGGEV